jgi:hypothetical protein
MRGCRDVGENESVGYQRKHVLKKRVSLSDVWLDKFFLTILPRSRKSHYLSWA